MIGCLIGSQDISVAILCDENPFWTRKTSVNVEKERLISIKKSHSRLIKNYTNTATNSDSNFKIILRTHLPVARLKNLKVRNNDHLMIIIKHTLENKVEKREIKIKSPEFDPLIPCLIMLLLYHHTTHSCICLVMDVIK